MSNVVTEREQRLIGMINDLLISMDRIAVSKGMGASRAEAIRAIENYQVYWRRWKEQYIWDTDLSTDNDQWPEEYEGTLIPYYEFKEKE